MPDTIKKSEVIQDSIVSDMSDGVIVLGMTGKIELVNPAALQILGKTEEELKGNSFSRCFFDRAENDAFVQAILDAVYEADQRHVNYVSYYTGDIVKQLRLITSFQKEKGKKVGVIAVISDLTEIDELRDAVKAMKRIQKLNQQLEIRNKLLKSTFGRYLSDDIVKQILETPHGLELGGKKAVVTIMMSDLRGFTAMCERMNPQDLTRALNHYFQEMYEEISQYKGTLVEFLGDGLFVIFGAPIEAENHASDAVACAVGMQSRMDDINRWNEANGFEPFAMGIGINTGEVVIGNIGSDRRTKYGVMGANVNLAGRVESYTTDGQILISPSTREAVLAELTVAHEFPVTPKGVKEEIVISEITGIGAPYDRFLTIKQEPLTALPKPCSVSFRILSGKHVEQEVRRGTIEALSEKRAMLKTTDDIKEFDNLLIDIGEELYAKVKNKNDDGAEIIFTAKPGSFSVWMEEALGVEK